MKDSWVGLTTDYQGGLWLCSFNNGVMYYNSKSTMTSIYKNDISDADANSRKASFVELSIIKNLSIEDCKTQSIKRTKSLRDV